jgi:hypothetical protein
MCSLHQIQTAVYPPRNAVVSEFAVMMELFRERVAKGTMSA